MTAHLHGSDGLFQRLEPACERLNRSKGSLIWSALDIAHDPLSEQIGWEKSQNNGLSNSQTNKCVMIHCSLDVFAFHLGSIVITITTYLATKVFIFSIATCPRRAGYVVLRG